MGLIDRFRRGELDQVRLLEPLLAQVEAKQRLPVAQRRAELVVERRDALARGEAAIARAEAEATAARKAWEAAQPLHPQAVAAEYALVAVRMALQGAVAPFDRELRATVHPAVAELEADIDALLFAVAQERFSVGEEPAADSLPDERVAIRADSAARRAALRAARRECTTVLELVDDLTAVERVAELRGELAQDLDRFLAGRAS